LSSVVLQAILGAIKLINGKHWPTLPYLSVWLSTFVSSKCIHS
jgi:hypothetical protein